MSHCLLKEQNIFCLRTIEFFVGLFDPFFLKKNKKNEIKKFLKSKIFRSQKPGVSDNFMVR